MLATTQPYGTYQRFAYQTVRLPALRLPNLAPVAYPLLVALATTAGIALAMAAAYIVATAIIAALPAVLTAVATAIVAIAPTVGNLIIGAVVTAIAAKAMAFLSRL